MHVLPLALPLATLLMAAAFTAPAQAQAPKQTQTQAQIGLAAPLLGAWGSDSSCTADVVVFRADGTVVDTGAVAGTPRTTFGATADTITFTQGDKTGQFALAVGDQAIAWSNGASIVLKERCADQARFASDFGPAPAPASLFDRIRALAAQPLHFNGVTIRVVAVDSRTALAPAAETPLYSEVIAQPDPAVVGAGAALLYRVFPTAAAAAAYVSLALNARTSFIYEHRGAGFFLTAAATDEGKPGNGGGAVPIDCLRFHPRGKNRVEISCFAQMPASRLVAGARQAFPLPAGAKAKDMGSAEDLSETLDLTSLAIDTLRGLATQGAGN